ncbi:MAG: helix-turn-helix transcriptional regulator [Prolixibacteraceae bacterium]|nr:helix-turn-helix transcriptional regulator [Prolixibacteraceae bacterium]
MPNKLLAFIFLIPGLYFVDNIFILNGFIHHIPFSFFFVQIIAIAYPLVFHAYVHILVGKRAIPHWILLTGSALLLLFILYLTIGFYLLPPLEKTQYLSSLNTSSYPASMAIYTSLFYFWQMVYFSVVTYSAYKHGKFLSEHISNTDGAYIGYIKQFVGLLWILNLILVILYLSLPTIKVDYLFLPVVVGIIYLFVLYIIYHHNSIFTQHSYNILLEKNLEAAEDKPDLNQKSDSKKQTDRHNKIYELLQVALLDEKVYQNPDLTLKLLSQKIGHPTYLVSQTISIFYMKSFFDLINELRIQSSKERLKNFSEKDTIENIAYEVGFNSRAAFYRAFRKYTGETPKEQFINSK